MAELFDSLACRTSFTHFCKYEIAFCSRPEAASDVISGTFVSPIIRDKHVKFRDPCLNRSPEIQPEAVGCGIFDGFFAITSDQKQLVIISSEAVEWVGVDVRVKFGDSRSNLLEIFESLSLCWTTMANGHCSVFA